MCFAPQRRALFRHRNFKKWSEVGVFCTFWLGNVLRATTACAFSSLIWPAGSAPAALASLLFDPPEPQIIGKTQWIATFSVSRRSYLFAHLHLLSSDLFSSDSSHLCFSTVDIVGSFTSKLPSINHPFRNPLVISIDNISIHVPKNIGRWDCLHLSSVQNPGWLMILGEITSFFTDRTPPGGSLQLRRAMRRAMRCGMWRGWPGLRWAMAMCLAWLSQPKTGT